MTGRSDVKNILTPVVVMQSDGNLAEKNRRKTFCDKSIFYEDAIDTAKFVDGILFLY